ncbi:toxin-antitoxin system HicB family antitoxin [Fervidibacillus albus]|uniref:Toxin-antitoxin system HicB family antitoxin n=1 Tax=Fervidibacillus albus TaxID=2980026 RepID=A0A9E8RVK4_9BACI|nr:toxin-antitoxin system HicB family antitoxin [Fervidibacillus albus]WAA09033.1 toxin-antitoxin system HicB family antitoxin [Fervidibacillus albus]
MAKKKQFPLRIDPDLYNAIERWAQDEFRSVNGHIEYLLREAVLKSGRSIHKEKKKKNE